MSLDVSCLRRLQKTDERIVIRSLRDHGIHLVQLSNKEYTVKTAEYEENKITVKKLKKIIGREYGRSFSKDIFTRNISKKEPVTPNMVHLVLDRLDEKKIRQNAMKKAIADHDLTTVRKMIEQGYDVNQRDEKDNTCLFDAVESGNPEIVKLLVENGADTRHIPCLSCTGIIKTALVRKPDIDSEKLIQIVGELLKHGADPNHISEALGCSNLEYALEITSLTAIQKKSLVESMLEHGADPNLTVFFYPLERTMNDPELTELLLARGADPALPSFLLSQAARFGDERVLNLLLETHKLDIDEKDETGKTPLMYACQKEKPQKIKTLLEYGANTEIRDPNGKTAGDFFQPCKWSHFEISNLEKFNDWLNVVPADYMKLYKEGCLTNSILNGANRSRRSVHSEIVELRTGKRMSDVQCCFQNHQVSDIDFFLEWVYSGKVSSGGKEVVVDILKELGISREEMNQKSGAIGFRNDMKRWYSDESSKDFTIMDSEGGNLRVHRLMMAARSELYRGMFSTVSDDSATVSDYSRLSFSALRQMIHYFYTGEIDPNIDNRTLGELQKTDAPDYFGLKLVELNDENPFSFYNSINQRLNL